MTLKEDFRVPTWNTLGTSAPRILHACPGSREPQSPEMTHGDAWGNRMWFPQG